MTKFKNLKTGECLSETQYYKVVRVSGDKAQLSTDNGENIVVDSNYVETYLTSASQYDKEEKVNRTTLYQTIMNHPRTVMTVNYNKQVKEGDVVKKLEEAFEKSTISTITKNIRPIVKQVLEGEERTLRGRHNSSLDAGGRIQFVDMEIDYDSSKDYDSRMRLVDPRTLNWAIINNVKYVVK